MRLFLLQPAAGQAAACFKQWQDLCRTEDVTVLMGYSAIAITSAQMALGHQLYVLTTEADLIPAEWQQQIAVIDYTELAQWVVKAEKHVTLR